MTKVLLVDDFDDWRWTTRMLLEAAGAEVAESQDATEARCRCRQLALDVAVIADSLRGADELARSLHAERPAMRLVAVSTLLRARVQRAPYDLVVPKLLEPVAFMEAVLGRPMERTLAG